MVLFFGPVLFVGLPGNFSVPTSIWSWRNSILDNKLKTN